MQHCSRLSKLCSALAIATCALSAYGQNFPSKPVRIVAPEAGGDLFHSGGRQFESKDDPDYKILMQWAGAK